MIGAEKPAIAWAWFVKHKVAIAVSVCGLLEVNHRINAKNSGCVQQPEFKPFAKTASHELGIDQ